MVQFFRSLEVTVPDHPVSTTIRPSNGPGGSDMELHHGETFNLVEEVYVVEDSKKELNSVTQKQHLSVFTEETLQKTLDSIIHSLPCAENSKECLKNVPSECKDEENSQTDFTNIPSPTHTTSDSMCNGLRTPRNLSPVSEESAGDCSTLNLDPAMKTYVSYSTPSLDDVTIVEAVPKSEVLTESNQLNHTSHDVHKHKPIQHFVVVAIDIGTTYSGYAFCFTRDPDSTIHMMRKWEGELY